MSCVWRLVCAAGDGHGAIGASLFPERTTRCKRQIPKIGFDHRCGGLNECDKYSEIVSVGMLNILDSFYMVGVMTNEIIFYILMRTDLASLNPGKAMAQASHAYGALKKAVRVNMILQPTYLEWANQTDQEFGTTIVLGGNWEEIGYALRMASYTQDVIATWVHDPTYPIEDGACRHLIPLSACAIVFGLREDCKMAVEHMRLHL